MTYWVWLAGISAAFAALERALPERPAQRALRPQLANDLFYLVFNGHVWAVLTSGLAASVALGTRAVLADLSLLPERGLLDGRPFLVQALVWLVAKDLVEWCVHVTLHRVPFLWQLHKVHHSVQRMDWIANFRFHWTEHVVYGALKYVPLACWLGGDAAPLFAVAVFSTAWGHFNHANLRVELGPLGYVFNSPRMHLWHHDASDEGGASKNYGIVLSLWDWLFGTAYWPRDRAPRRIGYAGDGEMPRGVPGQLLFPLARGRGAAGEAA